MHRTLRTCHAHAPITNHSQQRTHAKLHFTSVRTIHVYIQVTAVEARVDACTDDVDTDDVRTYRMHVKHVDVERERTEVIGVKDLRGKRERMRVISQQLLTKY